jgi:hypothetical protein
MSAIRGGARFGVAAAMAILAGCGSSAGSGGGGVSDTLRNLVRFGSTTEPPIAKPIADEVECPSVDIASGGAALRTLASRGSEGESVRSQISITETARECAAAPGGGTKVKVGVEGRVLLGPGGVGGTYETNVNFVLKRGDRILASRTRRVAASVPAGDTQGSFVVVEDGLVAPAGTGEFEIEVGLGSGFAAKPERRRR